MTVKFVFHLKSGKTFECIEEELSQEDFASLVNVAIASMKDGVSGVLVLTGCCVRLSECAVVEWEVLR